MSRLIDADALKKEWSMGDKCEDCPQDTRRCQYDVDFSRMDICQMIDDAPTIGGWISVKDRLPVETHSIFYPFYGTQKWSNAMWREQSDKVLVTVAFKDGTKTVTTGATHDGVWNTTISRTLEPVVTHWQAMPEPPKEKNNAEK